MIGDPEWNVVKAVFCYPVAHNIRSAVSRMKIIGKWIKVLLKLMFCKNEVTNGARPKDHALLLFVILKVHLVN